MKTTPLIGRREEIARLKDHCAGAENGTGAVVLLSGEVGVGKTSLVEEALAASNLKVFAAHVREEPNPPFAAIASLLRDYLRSQKNPKKACGPLAEYLALLLPELGPGPELDDPNLLNEAIIGALAAAAGNHPTALFIDDLQWADNATHDLIAQLPTRISDVPLLLVATYRSDEIPRGHPIRKMRDDLRRARHLNEISVGPLDQEATAQILERVLGSKPSEALVAMFHEQTQGLPMFVEELAQALQSGGAIAGDETLEVINGMSIPLPDSIRDAVILRLDSLAPEARQQLDVAAVAGTEFDLEMVTSIAGTETGLDELIDRNLIIEMDSSRGSFRHALVREAVKEEIPRSERRSLHKRIAAYLERIGAPPELVAEHWIDANELEPARRALLDLAEHSCRLHAYRDAAQVAQRALGIWPEGQDESTRVDTLVRLAHCAEVSGQLGDAVRALREADGSSALDEDPVRRAEIHRSRARILELQGSWEQALEAHRQAADTFESAGSGAEAAVEWLAVSARQCSASELEQAVDSARRAGDLAIANERTDLEARAKAFEGNVQAMRGNGDTGRQLAQDALTLALELGQADVTANVYNRLASVLEYCSDFGASADAYTAAVDFCRQEGDEFNASVCMGCMTYSLFRIGDWKRTLEVCDEVIAGENSPRGALTIARFIAGYVFAHRGNIRVARKHLQEAARLAGQTDVVSLDLFTRFGLALITEQENETEQTAELHQNTLQKWQGTQDKHDMVPVFMWQSTFFGMLGREKETHQRADALTRMAAGGANLETIAALGHALGEVALLAGDTSEAIRHFREALTQIEKLDIPLELAFTGWRYAAALLANGDSDGAIRQLGVAYRIARKLGARPLAARIAANLDALGAKAEEGRHPDQESLAGRGGLTRRQVEILRLVAEGLTNKEIADRLYLSTRTVDMHLRNILDRLDCRSRVEATRKARELDLLI